MKAFWMRTWNWSGIGVSLVFGLVALTGVYAFDPRAFFFTVVLFVIGAAYFFGYSRNHLVAKTAAEEFAMLEAAEHELEDDAEATPSMATPKAAS